MIENSATTEKLNYFGFLFGVFLLVIGVRLVLIDMHAVTTPYWDDWGIGGFLAKSVTEGLTFNDFVRDANEHRLVFNRILSLLLFKLNHHQWDPQVSMIANTVIWALFCVFMVRLVIIHLEPQQRIVVLAVLLALFIYPLSLVNILWGVQTHTYTMILFSVLGCWYAYSKALSAKWFFGIICLFAATLTLAGGTFAAFSVAALSTLSFLTHKDSRRDSALTAAAAALAGLFGLMLILVQANDASSQVSINLSDFLTSFLKVMSWPNSQFVWPSIFLSIPALLLLAQYFFHRDSSNNLQLIRFTLTVYGFVVLIALAVAYARGAQGIGPARRYFEFLSLLPIASLLSVVLLTKIKVSRFANTSGIFIGIWLALIIAALPWLQEVNRFTLEDRANIKPVQEKLVRSYLNTRELSVLEGKPFRHAPFPRADLLAGMLDELNEADVLPTLLQTPQPLTWRADNASTQIEQSPFMVNGTFSAAKNLFRQKRLGEDVFGSYKPLKGGMAAVGKFESEVIRINRSYASIPVLGYLGYPGLILKLVDVGSGREFNITPESLDSKNAEFWSTIQLAIPRGYYRVVAEDNNPNLWFAFATPRSMGRLSYFSEKLVKHSHWVWKFGLILLLISLRQRLFNLVTTRDHQSAGYA